MWLRWPHDRREVSLTVRSLTPPQKMANSVSSKAKFILHFWPVVWYRRTSSRRSQLGKPSRKKASRLKLHHDYQSRGQGWEDAKTGPLTRDEETPCTPSTDKWLQSKGCKLHYNEVMCEFWLQIQDSLVLLRPKSLVGQGRIDPFASYPRHVFESEHKLIDFCKSSHAPRSSNQVIPKFPHIYFEPILVRSSSPYACCQSDIMFVRWHKNSSSFHRL